MLSICGWCNRQLHRDKLSGTTSVGKFISKQDQNMLSRSGEKISHGICDSCMQDQLSGANNKQPQLGVAHESFRSFIENKSN